MSHPNWLSSCLLLASVGLLPALSSAEEPTVETIPAPAIASPSAEQLIEQLGDVDYRKRDAASKALEAMGVPVLPALRKARDHSDPEVQRRINVILPRLETAALLAPKRVTIDLKKRTVRQLLDEFTKKTGYKFETWGGDDQHTYDLKCDNLPFWEAFDRLCQAAGLVMQVGYGDNIIRLHQQDSFVPFVHYQGSFRVIANSFSHNRSIDFSALPRTTGGVNRSE